MLHLQLRRLYLLVRLQRLATKIGLAMLPQSITCARAVGNHHLPRLLRLLLHLLLQLHQSRGLNLRLQLHRLPQLRKRRRLKRHAVHFVDGLQHRLARRGVQRPHVVFCKRLEHRTKPPVLLQRQRQPAGVGGVRDDLIAEVVDRLEVVPQRRRAAKVEPMVRPDAHMQPAVPLLRQPRPQLVGRVALCSLRAGPAAEHCLPQHPQLHIERAAVGGIDRQPRRAVLGSTLARRHAVFAQQRAARRTQRKANARTEEAAQILCG
mmetsp:Transcript_22724/g.76677  ORF Transcript_22724/g.76677 Transcript_22724/m.76677 type:complete len:263 (-) Transcript_22724:288-1076(-)